MQRRQAASGRAQASEATSIEAAIKQLQLALDSLEAAAERKLQTERRDLGLADQVHALDRDRAQLAAELDSASARVRRLETANRDIAQRLDAAIETVRVIIAGQAR